MNRGNRAEDRPQLFLFIRKVNLAMLRQLPLFTTKVETYFIGSVLVFQTTYADWNGHIFFVSFIYERVG